MDITIFKKLGLSDKEIKVYLGLLEYGAISVRGLAELVNLNRGTVYDILKKLQEQGLVTYYHHETKQKFAAEDPDKLIHLLEEKENELRRVKGGLLELVPELKSIQDKDESSPTSKYYEGKRGIRLILEDLLDTIEKEKDKEYYIYSAKLASDDIYSAYPGFTKDRIKKKIHCRAISLASGGGTSGLDERRWLGTNDETATFIIIYTGKCAYISRDIRDNPVGVIIENKMIYETHKIIFNKLWELLKNE